MRGNQRDNDWTIFDYRYTVGSGKNQTTYCQTIAAITLQNFNFPSFMLLPENFFYKIADFVGYKDIDFSDKPLFSKNYFLKGPDETAIRNLFSREIMSFFERENYKGHLEANDRYILIYTPGRRIEPQNFRQFLENSGKIIRAFTGK
jgi:hypothetical protein